MNKFYTKDHEWISVVGNIAVVGITKHAAEALGDIVFVQLPNVDDECKEESSVSVIESVKAASDVYSPVNCKVVDVNFELNDSPDKVSSDPEGEGWLFKCSFDGDTSKLLSYDEYQKLIS